MSQKNMLRIGFIGLGQRGAAYGMTDGSIGLLGNVLKNSDGYYFIGYNNSKCLIDIN